MDFKELQTKVIKNAYLLGIDLEEAINKKWINKKKQK